MTPNQLNRLFAREERQKAALARTQAALSRGIAAYSTAQGYRMKLRPEAVRMEVSQ